MEERLGIAGSGTIACGLAVVAAQHGEVMVWARSARSARRARERVKKTCERLDDEIDAERVHVVTDLDELAHDTSFVVESVAEHVGAKTPVLRDLGRELADDAVLATTTSSLGVEALAHASGRPERFCAFHVFNPVPKMELVELSFPTRAEPQTRARARALADALGKTAVEVPDVPGFVVNRLLFPYLFSAVRLLEETGLAPEDVDACMTLGAGHPMGPLALLDLIGLDVAVAIGEEVGAEVPDRVRALADDGALGRKAKRGFHVYE
jgi:3-hydroxybutyryl-CoA dehydrogenase